MKICIAQSSSVAGEITQNIENHLRLIDTAIQFQTDLIVFPELSITGYEPSLAHELACHLYDNRFEEFQQRADTHQIIVSIGVPTRSSEGINISMILFQHNQERSVYSKHLLHVDELPYFVSGKDQSFLLKAEKRIAVGICYETLKREHFIQAKEHGAEFYIASVAKPDRGTSKAYPHFSDMAEEFDIPILMANCVGFCDNFLSNGKSAVWNRNGKMIAQLDETNQGLIVYDTTHDQAHALIVDN